MAFSRAQAKAKPAAASTEDPEAAAWQAQLAKETEERSRAGAFSAVEEAKKKAAAEDARWKETHQTYSSNLADAASKQKVAQSQLDEEKARQQRIERSKAEAAKRAMGSSGGFGAGQGGGVGSGGGRSDFAWKKPAAAGGGGYAARSAPPADMGDLPSHDDSELAVSAMISRTLQGMKEGLRQIGLPDYPLKFIPGRELQLCGHDVREVINEMIHAWMTDEKDEFYNVLLRIKSIVANPILTEEEMALMQHQEAWDRRDTPAGAQYTQKTAGGIGPAAKPKPVPDEDSEDEVIDLSSAPPGRQQEAARPGQHSFAKPVVTAPAGPVDGEDHYELLGIPPTATLQEIRMKFRQLVVTEHPEKGGDPKKFAKLNKAYGVLSDQEKRRQYDDQRK